jgi:two-component system, NtrC family, response regulator
MSTEAQTRRLLIVEDDAALRAQLKWSFEGCEVEFAENRTQAIAALRQFEPQVVLQDLGLPPDAEGATEGFATLTQILDLAPATKVIVVTGNHEKDRAVTAISMGAYDFYEKPVDLDVLRLIVGRAFQIWFLEREVDRLRKRETPQSFEGIIAVDRSMQNVCRMIEKIAPADVAVLILGESGTGKELLSRALHNLSNRRDKRFVAVSCAAIPEQQLEAELFGYEEGAFAGAVKATPGKIEYADGGTLFLDEIGDMPLSLQARLLRFLQNKVIERAGGRHEIPVDVRIVAATNQSIEALIREQKFRQDLYYRLGEVTVNVPPLRERPGDILAIAHAFLARYSNGENKPKRGFTDEAIQVLTAHPWPGNVRELENKIKVACLLGDTPIISAQDLGLASIAAVGTPLNLKEVRNRAERDAVTRAMAASAGNVSRAAELLGVSRPTLYDLMSRHDLGAAGLREAALPESAGGAA